MDILLTFFLKKEINIYDLLNEYTHSQAYHHLEGLEEIKQVSIIACPKKRHSRRGAKMSEQMFAKAKQMFWAVSFSLTPKHS